MSDKKTSNGDLQSKNFIYLDNAASTPMWPRAVEAMMPLLADSYGNPSGAHRMARMANKVLDRAREQIAEAVGSKPGEVVFTGGGTEADNLAITGAVASNPGATAICSAVEHHAVLDPVQYHDGKVVPVTSTGRIDLDALAAACEEAKAASQPVAVVSLMLANNETGVIQPLAEAVEIVRRLAPTALIHSDCVQAMCWLDLAELTAEVDLVSISAHKFGGPKGVGALIIRNQAKLVPLLKGGSQERSRRAGTHNVAGIAAMAVAAEETIAARSQQIPRVKILRDRLVQQVKANVAAVFETGVDLPPGLAGAGLDPAHKTANIAHLCFEGIASETLLYLLETDGVMASAASSCSSGAIDPSHVLSAMGYSRELAFGSLRLSLGYGTTEADIDRTADAIGGAVERMRQARESLKADG